MSVLLGAPVWYGNRPFRRTIEKLHKLGLDYLEFSLDYPLPGSMKEADKKELKGLLADYGMRIAFHSPIDIAVMHPREEIADASMRILRQCMEFSAGFTPLYLQSPYPSATLNIQAPGGACRGKEEEHQ